MVPVKHYHQADCDPEPDRSVVKTPVKQHEPKAQEREERDAAAAREVRRLGAGGERRGRPRGPLLLIAGGLGTSVLALPLRTQPTVAPQSEVTNSSYRHPIR